MNLGRRHRLEPAIRVGDVNAVQVVSLVAALCLRILER
jgi:hypothetical protein